MNTRIRFILALIAAFVLNSCSPTTEPPDDQIPVDSSRTLYILNEGAFGKANASLDTWNFTDASSKLGVKTAIGDVGSDLKVIGNRIYAVFNGSGKIMSYDSTLTSRSIQFEAGAAPARIAKTAEGEAWVTQLYANRIAVINTDTDVIKEYIDVPTGTRGIAILGGKAYCANDNHGVMVIDLTTRAIQNATNICNGANDVIADSVRGSIIIIGVGDWATSAPCQITWLNPTNMTVTKKITLDASEVIWSMYPGVVTENKLYITAKGHILEADLDTKELASTPYKTEDYYGGIYDPLKKYLIFGSAVDFLNPDKVDIYDATSGVLVKSFPAGIAAGHFAIW